MPFLTPLDTRAVGRNKWQLLADLEYVTAGTCIIVKKGFVCDLASIPRIFQLLIPVNDRHRQAATLHDWLYVTNRFTRAQCDKIFLQAMKESGVPWWKRHAMYLAVRVGGWLAYNKRGRK